MRGVATLVLLLGATGVACGANDEPDEPRTAAFPDDLTAYIDQSRLQREGRTLFVRLVNEAERRVTVTHADIESPRFGEITWVGEKSFENEADLEFELPRAGCGTGSDAEVRLTYRLDDGPELQSTTTATDRYGAVALFMDRDCAEERLRAAATLELGVVRIVGEGKNSVYELPVTLTPTGAQEDVGFVGFEDTVLFRQVFGSAHVDEGVTYPLGPDDPPVEVVLRLVPGRCDPHALADDKVGTLVPVRVTAPDLPSAAAFYLPIGDDRRAVLRGFVPTYCGW
ncbi:hypothetical protein [Nocardioides sp.]|uniref:hypothetical protein n=1 Tax=Nocardioides sp. TaxID=35761 RepID=UPI00273544E8|nr:hypothetical protein [Nocardioides sp.]MDP3894985.1 hypothetical protein [Nocardioides sp.]